MLLLLIVIIVLVYFYYKKTSITSFRHREPKEQYPFLVKELGKPDLIYSDTNGGIAKWHNVQFYENVMLLDELITNNETGKPEFLYANVKMEIPFSVLYHVLGLSRSVYYDRLTKELTVRSHSLPVIAAHVVLALLIAEDPNRREEYYKQLEPMTKQVLTDSTYYLNLNQQISEMILINHNKYSL